MSEPVTIVDHNPIDPNVLYAVRAGRPIAIFGRRYICDEPRPDEPQGLGAVVEDVDGERWVLSRDAHPGLFRVRWENPKTLAYRTYAGIDVVRVLSEGLS